MALFASITGPTVQNNDHVSSVDKFRYPLGAQVVVGRRSKSKIPAGSKATIIEKFDPCHPKYKVRDESGHVSKIAEKHLFPAASPAKDTAFAVPISTALLMRVRSTSPRPESPDREMDDSITSCGMQLRRSSLYQYSFVKGMALTDTTNGKCVTVLSRSGGANFEDPLYLVLYEQNKQRKRVRQSDLIPIIALRTIISSDNLEQAADPANFTEMEVESLENHDGEAVIAQPFQEGEEFSIFNPPQQFEFYDEGERDNETVFNSFGPFVIDEELPSYSSHYLGAAAA